MAELTKDDKSHEQMRLKTHTDERSDVQEVSSKELKPMKCCIRKTSRISQHDLKYYFQSIPCLMMFTLMPKGTAVQLCNLSSPFLPCLAEIIHHLYQECLFLENKCRIKLKKKKNLHEVRLVFVTFT